MCLLHPTLYFICSQPVLLTSSIEKKKKTTCPYNCIQQVKTDMSRIHALLFIYININIKFKYRIRFHRNETDIIQTFFRALSRLGRLLNPLAHTHTQRIFKNERKVEKTTFDNDFIWRIQRENQLKKAVVTAAAVTVESGNDAIVRMGNQNNCIGA